MDYERGGEVHDRNSREIPTTATDSLSIAGMKGFFFREPQRHEQLGGRAEIGTRGAAA